MGRSILICGLLLSTAACAFNQPPLLEQDGQYQETRKEKAAKRQASRQVSRVQAALSQAQVDSAMRATQIDAQRAPVTPQAMAAQENKLVVPEPGTAPAPSTPRVGAISAEPVAMMPTQMAAVQTTPTQTAPPQTLTAKRPKKEPNLVLPPELLREAQSAPLGEAVAVMAPVRAFPELGPVPQIAPQPIKAIKPSQADGPYFTSEATLPKKASTVTPPPALKPAAPMSEISATPKTPKPMASMRKSSGIAPTEGVITAPRIVAAAAPGAIALTPQPTRRINMPAAPASAAPQALRAPLAAPAVTPNAAPQAAPMAQAETPSATAASTTSTDIQRAAAEKVLLKVNALRQEYGYLPLQYSERLSEIAQGHVIGLAATGTVTSKDPTGQSIGIRLLNQGYIPSIAGSVVAGGYPSFDAAFKSWTKNEVEASRLLLPQATEMGFAIITDPQSTYRTYIEAIIAAE